MKEDTLCVAAVLLWIHESLLFRKVCVASLRILKLEKKEREEIGRVFNTKTMIAKLSLDHYISQALEA